MANTYLQVYRSHQDKLVNKYVYLIAGKLALWSEPLGGSLRRPLVPTVGIIGAQSVSASSYTDIACRARLAAGRAASLGSDFSSGIVTGDRETADTQF